MRTRVSTNKDKYSRCEQLAVNYFLNIYGLEHLLIKYTLMTLTWWYSCSRGIWLGRKTVSKTLLSFISPSTTSVQYYGTTKTYHQQLYFETKDDDSQNSEVYTLTTYKVNDDTQIGFLNPYMTWRGIHLYVQGSMGLFWCKWKFVGLCSQSGHTIEVFKVVSLPGIRKSS